jgi:hypothetical protein
LSTTPAAAPTNKNNTQPPNDTHSRIPYNRAQKAVTLKPTQTRPLARSRVHARGTAVWQRQHARTVVASPAAVSAAKKAALHARPFKQTGNVNTVG